MRKNIFSAKTVGTFLELGLFKYYVTGTGEEEVKISMKNNDDKIWSVTVNVHMGPGAKPQKAKGTWGFGAEPPDAKRYIGVWGGTNRTQKVHRGLGVESLGGTNERQ